MEKQQHCIIPVVSKHGEVSDVSKFPVPRSPKPVPQVGREYLSSLQEDDGLSVVGGLISKTGEGGGELVCQSHCVFITALNQSAYFTSIVLWERERDRMLYNTEELL